MRLLSAGFFHGASPGPHPQILCEAAHLGPPAAAQAVLQALHERQPPVQIIGCRHQALQEFGHPHQLHLQGPVSHVVTPLSIGQSCVCLRVVSVLKNSSW